MAPLSLTGNSPATNPFPDEKIGGFLQFTFNLNFNSNKNFSDYKFFLKKYTTLGYIVSLILLNFRHVFRFRIVSRICQLEEEGSPR